MDVAPFSYAMWLNTSKRRHLRVPYNREVVFRAGENPNAFGIIRDVGLGGAYLLSNGPFLNGTHIAIYLPLQVGKKKKVCLLEGTVVRRGDSGFRGLHGHGIEFEGGDLAETSRQLLEEFVFTTSGQSPIPASLRETAPEKKVERILPDKDDSFIERILHPFKRK